MATSDRDRWARWVLGGRDGDDREVRARRTAQLAAYRDGVLARAAVGPGDTLLDVGCGDGLIAFGALERVGGHGRVIFSDVSADLLAECRRRATADGLLDRCRFVHAPADALHGIGDGSVDAVTTRSVLIYVDRKPAALAEFHRVLRPGGRLSVFEPINSFRVARDAGNPFGWDMTPVADLAEKVGRAFGTGDRAGGPMLGFDERDLLRWVEQAGFTEIELDYQALVGVPSVPPTWDWEVLKRTAPNPLAPTIEQALAQALTDRERARFEEYVRSLLAAGEPTRDTVATVFLRAVRP